MTSGPVVPAGQPPGQGALTSLWDVLWRRRMVVSIVAAIAGVAIGLLSVPDFETQAQRQNFSNFFGTSAQVIATLLVALALGARFAPSDAPLAVITVVYVGIGEVAAVTALSSVLPASL